MTQHSIQTQLPDDDFLQLKEHCAHVRRSQAWVAREAIREYLNKEIYGRSPLGLLLRIKNEQS